ncbi:Ig-like domain-containing protein [Patescibacteria group bacterium]|nr:Ig-like domain-containing protein [Patescibacteria group bacterium]MBU1683585.1 Ig-like domain-containing protein [Patescibacteria group bacterium]MBU1935530.1 Ig-like domain-containing protein [Patescibacteria group bacterium]
MKLKIKTLAVVLLLALQSVIVPAAMAGFLPVAAYGTDTIAGYAAKLSTSLITPGRSVRFVVEKADGSVLQVDGEADLEGIAEADLYGYQTKVAGQYRVAVVYPGSSDSSPQSSFTVYADQVSTTQSIITSTDQMITADGDEKTFVTVTLYDAYRNPIKNHHVQLISSRSKDKITPLSDGVTDSSGRANFKVTSEYDGVSVFTAMDATVNKVLSDREEIVFFAPIETAYGGSNIFSANLFTADIGQGESSEVLPGPVDSFDIEDLPSSVKVNTDQTITVIARDKDGNTAKNYTGTILFSTPDDEHAILPNNGEYTFKETDQGEFTFNLALRFTQIGDQVIQVFDKNNWQISGERELEVVPAQAVVTPDVSSTLSIKSPVDGAELGSTLVVISGQGDPNINLKVFDNDVKIGESETDSDGFFSYQAQNLTSGSHTFYVMSDSGYVSRSITIQVDTIPPVLNYFDISPDGIVAPGTALTITAQSEPNLEEVKIRIQGALEVLPQSGSQPGTYTATVTAPVIDGSYSIDVILIDSLANKSELLNQTVVQVATEEDVLPPTVSGVSGAPGDSSVILTWHEVTGHETAIQNYRIYFGNKYDELSQVVETTGAVTSYTLENLVNNTQYFFAVTAVDSKGLESEDKSTIIAVTPVSDEPEVTDATTEPTDVTVVTLPTTAPSSIQGIASQDSVILSWQASTDPNTYFYKVYFGIRSGRYDDYAITSGSSPSITIKDLITGIPYYFAVVALNIYGQEISTLSQEFAVIPAGIGFHAASSTDLQTTYYTAPLTNTQLTQAPETEGTGPEAVWIVVISLVVANFLYNHKKRILN